MQAANPGPLDAESIAKIYETIVSQCIRAQERNGGAPSQQPVQDGAPQSAAPGKRETKSKATKAGQARKSRKGRK